MNDDWLWNPQRAFRLIYDSPAGRTRIIELCSLQDSNPVLLTSNETHIHDFIATHSSSLNKSALT